MKLSKMLGVERGVVIAAVLAAGTAWGGPGLEITKPPVTPVPSFTGPAIDPHAVSGQWLVDRQQLGAPVFRPFEFHDNVLGQGGGFAGPNAIFGKAVNVVTDANNFIQSFSIMASITNDMPSTTPWVPGSNSHGEQQQTGAMIQYEGMMWATALTASFAIGPVTPPVSSPPYTDIQPHIQAVNHDKLAWYCWTPGAPNQPAGGYFVPTWDFGDIPVGMTVTRQLDFTVLGGGLSPADPRHLVITESSMTGLDLFLNRSTSLKVSDWLDTLGLDNGVAYPTPPSLSSDVSVFYVPEPATLAIMAVGSLLLARKRR